MSNNHLLEGSTINMYIVYSVIAQYTWNYIIYIYIYIYIYLIYNYKIICNNNRTIK